MLRNNRALSLTALGCALYQASKIVPYTPAWRRQVMAAAGERSARSLRLLTANVLMTNRRSQPLLDLIAREQPDIVCLLEPDQWWEQQIAAIEREFPHSVKCPIDNTYGMLVYSRLPLQGKKLLFRVQDDIPSAVLDV